MWQPSRIILFIYLYFDLFSAGEWCYYSGLEVVRPGAVKGWQMLVLSIHVATNLNLQTIIYGGRSTVNVIVATDIQTSRVLGFGDYLLFFLLKFWLPFSFLWSPASDKNHKTAVWEQSQRAVCVSVSVGRCCHASHDSLDISRDTCGAWQKVDSKVLQLIHVQSDPVLPIVNTFYYSWFCCSLFLFKYKRSRSTW